MIVKTLQLYKFSAYGFLKNLRLFEPFLILFFREQGLSFLQIGLLISVRETATTILEIPTGILADACGRKKAMIASFLAYILSFLIFYFKPVYGFYILAMLFFALGEAFRTGTHKAMILDYLSLHHLSLYKVDYYGYTRSWSQTGSALAALLAGLLVFYSGSYRYIFLASVVPYLLGLFLMISYPAELDGTRIPCENKGLGRMMLSQLQKTVRDFLISLKSGKLLRVLFNSTLYDGLFKSSKDYLQPLLQTFALSFPLLVVLGDKRDTITISVVYFVIYLLTAAASRNARHLVKQIQALPRAINLTFLAGTGLVIMAGIFTRINLLSASVLILVLMFIMQNLRRPLNVSYISDCIPSRLMASGLSVESQLKTLTTAVISPILGYMVDKWGIGSGLLICGLAILILFPLVRLPEKESACSENSS
ncbi:MAG: MFS transporter [Candidatus Cloacimonetes bacterium]|nr:MFS transporter [Candidatus Cloacimonadota bacterium]